MKISKALSIAALSIVLAACSNGPSDSDVQAIADQSLKQAEQLMSQMGINLTETFDMKVKVLNKVKQEDGRWLVEIETSATAKKDWQGGSKGEPLPGTPTIERVYMQKGDNGWIATN